MVFSGMCRKRSATVYFVYEKHGIAMLIPENILTTLTILDNTFPL